VLAKTFVISESDLRDIKVTDSTISLIGDPASKDFGLSYRGTVSPEVELKEDQNLRVYLYATCDEKSPSETKGIHVGIVTVGTLKQNNSASTLITTVETRALVPLGNTQCAKLGVGL
jgi:hypothetical protein